MKIDTYTASAEVAKHFGLTVDEGKYMKRIMIDESRLDSDEISDADIAEMIETAKRFAEENA